MKKNQERGNILPTKDLLCSYSNQNSVVLEEIQTYKSMKQNKESRNKPTQPGQMIFDKDSKTIQ